MGHPMDSEIDARLREIEAYACYEERARQLASALNPDELARALLSEIDRLRTVEKNLRGLGGEEEAGAEVMAPAEPAEPAEPADLVDNPPHYGGAGNPYEAIRVMLEWHGPEAARWFCQLNAEKYLARAGKKGDAGIDLRKAAWYAKTAALILEQGKVRP